MRKFTSLSNVLIALFFLLPQTKLYADSMESLDRRINEIEDQLKHLPIREPGDAGGNAGFLVAHLKRGEPGPHSVTIDLEKIYPIDHIVLIPMRLENIERQMEAMGFPVRFEIIGSEKADFSEPTYFYAGADENYPEPNGYPVIFKGKGIQARYIRLIVYDMPKVKSFRAFSLAELFVFSGGRNVALKKTVDAPTSDALDNIFDKTYLVDGQTAMGQPIIHSEHRPPGSGWRGWHAELQTDPTSNETVELQFAGSHEIDEIRLYPVYHSIWPKSADYGFPIHFRLQIKQSGSEWVTVEDWSKDPFPRPGNSPVTILLGGRNAHAIRLQALTLPNSVFRKYVFALAEMEVFADGVNIAPQGEIIPINLLS